MTEPASELEVLRNEIERLRKERDALRADAQSSSKDMSDLVETKLCLHASSLTNEIRENFWGTVKNGLWIVAILASIATAGGLLTLSDLLTSRIEVAIAGKHKEIDKVREDILAALVDVKVRSQAALQEVDELKLNIATTQNQLLVLGENVQKIGNETIAKMRGVEVNFALSVVAGKEPQKVTTFTQVETATNKSFSKGTVTVDSAWFGQLPDRFVAIAGSSANQVGMDTGTGGAFSEAFFPAFQSKQADKNANGRISLREATDLAASSLEHQNPSIDGQDQSLDLFTLSPAASKAKHKIWSILVGISNYPSSAGTNGSTKDIERLKALLRNGDQLLYEQSEVTVLLDSAATYQNIQEAIHKLKTSVGAEDTVLFYFSGWQGNTQSSNAEPIQKNLIPYDGEKGQLISASDLVNWIGDVPAGQRILIADV